MSDLFISRNVLQQKEWSSLYIDTIKNLRMLDSIKNDPHGGDIADRCFSAAVAEERKNQYMKINGVKRTTGSHCIYRLKGIKHQCFSCSPPGNDHGQLWIKDGKPYSYTFEPYHLRTETVKELVEFCEEHGFEFDITNNSFHFPTGTTFVEIKVKE